MRAGWIEDSHSLEVRMVGWLKRLWAELKRDHVAEQAAAREVFERRLQWSQISDPMSWDTGPEEGSDSPENSPEAVRPESRKSK